jgi:thiol:disulfide interchange protein
VLQYRVHFWLVATLAVVLGAAWTADASPNDPASFTAVVTPTPVHPGEVADVKVTASIDPGWHLYGLTTIAVSGQGISEAGVVAEDPPKHSFDSNFGKEVSFHLNRAVFDVPVRINSKDASTLNASVTVNYQTCNDRVCLPPTSKQLVVPIQVQAGPVRAQYAAAHTVPVPIGNIGLFLVAAFGAGLLALITPCVFPLIPITLTSFVKQADGDKRRLVQLSAGYSAGIVALYVAVGALTAVLLGASGISRIATNPWVNLFAFAVFMVFALSFFETIRIEIPGNIGALQQKARKQSGWLGLAALGTVFVLASFTCTAPFIGTLLVSAAGGSLLKPLLGMLIFAIAFVSPFLVFSFFPEWIAKIPKSGIWLARVKATLGFVEIAAALKFLSNADLVWQWHILTQPVLLAAWAMLFLCTALYLIGILRFGIVAETEPAGAKVSAGRGVFAALFLFAAVYCFWGLSGRPINPVIAAYLPPDGYGLAGQSIKTAGQPWLNDYTGALQTAKAESKPLLIDFTGYTCTNCRLNEKQVFPADAVQKELSKYVLVQLYTDGGPDASKNEALQISKFGDAALPLYGVIDPATEAVVAKTAGVQSVAGFAGFLNGAAGNSTLNTMWQPFSSQLVASTAAASQPAIVDFTANWCTNCKAIENTVFTDPSVVAKLQHFATYRSDMTNFSSPANTSLEEKYKIASLPAILFLDKNGNEIPGTRVSGLVTVAQFLAKVNAASH